MPCIWLPCKCLRNTGVLHPAAPWSSPPLAVRASVRHRGRVLAHRRRQVPHVPSSERTSYSGWLTAGVEWARGKRRCGELKCIWLCRRDLDAPPLAARDERCGKETGDEGDGNFNQIVWVGRIQKPKGFFYSQSDQDESTHYRRMSESTRSWCKWLSLYSSLFGEPTHPLGCP
jgi:hypothetical protein